MISYNELIKSQKMVQTLKTICNEFHVELVSQKLARAYPAELDRLKINEPLSLIREVILCGDGKRLVYGRTVIPYSTYLKHKEEFDNLGTKPLGDTFLYTNSKIDRSKLYFDKTYTNCDLRCSVFYFGDEHKLLITEIFLFELKNLLENPLHKPKNRL